VHNRVQALAHLFSTHASDDFHILRCLGLVQEFPSEGTSIIKYSFVFALPSNDTDPTALPVTLWDLLESKDPRAIPSLGDRFNLAKALASALALLHATRWLHKGLKSDNILFFRRKDQHRSHHLTLPVSKSPDATKPGRNLDRSPKYWIPKTIFIDIPTSVVVSDNLATRRSTIFIVSEYCYIKLACGVLWKIKSRRYQTMRPRISKECLLRNVVN